MRKPFIAGNWKMNKTLSEAEELVTELKELVADISGVEIGVCPPALNLSRVQEILADSNIGVGAQTMYWEKEGAFTGEISGPMLKDLGIKYIIIGHSERRQYFGETDQGVNRRVQAAFNYGLKPIVCVGETLKEREEEYTEKKVRVQVKSALAGLEAEQVAESVIAYEPIWAIGTGKSASAADANQVITYIRDTVREEYPEAADQLRIQYGGSVKPHNIKELMAEDGIDGALVGGASLEAKSFADIVKGAV